MPQSSQTSTDFYRLENNKNLSVSVRMPNTMVVFFCLFYQNPIPFFCSKKYLTLFVRGHLLYYVAVNYQYTICKKFFAYKPVRMPAVKWRTSEVIL